MTTVLLACLLAQRTERPGVRCVLVVPAGEKPFPNAQERLDRTLRDVQWWYGCQMQAYGYGTKTFSYETDGSGRLAVHLVHLKGSPPEGPEAVRAATIRAAEGVLGGVHRRRGTIMLMVYNGYPWLDRDRLQVKPMGDSRRGEWANLTAWHYYAQNPEGWREGTPIPELPLVNPFFPPLATAVYQSFGHDGVRSVADRTSVGYGVVAELLGEAFGLRHADRALPHVRGDVLSTDYWGMRGNFLPEVQGVWCCLTAPEAAALDRSPLFRVRPLGSPSTGAPPEVGSRGANR